MHQSKLLLLGTAMLALVATYLVAQETNISPSQAVLVLRVPKEDAVVKISDFVSGQRGLQRTYYFSNIAPGSSYSHTIEVQWLEDGATRKVVRQVEIQSGRSTTADFTKSDSPGDKLPDLKKDDDKKPATKIEDKKPVEKKKVDDKKPVEKKKAEDKKDLSSKERHFLFTYAGAVKDLKPGTAVQVWLPVAVSGPEQKVSIRSMNLAGMTQAKVQKEKEYGNAMVSFQAKADDKGMIPFEIVYDVTRREVKTNVQANLTLKPAPEDNLSRFLQPDAKVPIAGKPLDLLKDKKLPPDQFATAKVLYDVVNNHMKYSKDGIGWGQGDSVWACDSKFGNCSDFHSLFISMARGNKIPSKFEMGFPIPTKRGQGAVGGYHCWAWFYPNKKGWVPVDISEANRNPELKDYYFGNLTEDRVRFSTGRDINLEPRQKGAPLNFFIYPYAEVAGKAYPQEKMERRFAYEDVK